MRPVYPDGWREAPAERPTGALDGPPTPGIPRTPATYRAVILEPNPAARSVLEYLLVREGFRTEAHAEARFAEPGPALLLMAARDGLYVVESRDAAATLAEMDAATRASSRDLEGIAGLRAFLPKPFGARDVLRVVRAVNGSDGRDRTGTT